MLIAIALASIGMYFAISQQSSQGGNETTTAQAQKESCPQISEGISFYRSATWRWNQKLSLMTNRTYEIPEVQKAREIALHSCKYARWVGKLWQDRAAAARVKYEKWIEAHSLPVTSDWTTAVKISQRPFPGTDDWLMSCSGGEGGHGRWVPNSQGSGAGGWMQFLKSTFDSNYGGARVWLKSHGYIVPENVWSWYHPLGQALTASYMRMKGWSHTHWSPAIDSACY